MYREVVMLPEMVQAGMEALEESRGQGIGPEATAIAVFLAMRAIEEISVMRLASEAVH